MKPESPAPTLVEEVPLQSATELLDELASHHASPRLWGRSGDEGWIFRGQSDARWGLVPSAQRPGAFLPFIPGQVDDPALSPWNRQNLHEQEFAMKFAALVSRKGLEVPGDSPALRSLDAREERDENDHRFPEVKYQGIFALAQHFGVPTRLLDWTWSAEIGAYFAAADAARRIVEGRRESDGRLAVWALQINFVNEVCRHWSPYGVVTVSAPESSNPNLYLQQGLFTLVRATPPHNPSLGDEDAPHLDVLFSEKPGQNLPYLYKFTAPHSEARQLLYFLDRQGVSALTLYSGHAAVTRYMREAKYRQRPEFHRLRKG